jgi:predicted kinase
VIQHSIILISGAPASGKSTVARALAEAFGFSLLSKDTFKESLFTSLGALLAERTSSPEELSRMLSRAAMEVLWSLAPDCPQVILEANFRTKSEEDRARFGALQGRKLEIYCRCSPEEAVRRFRERAERTRHHPAHSVKSLSLDAMREYEQPFGLCPVIEVNTERPLDTAEIAARVWRHWPDLQMTDRGS